tara:strand:+ start:698 stop:2035 length:1338 start_codon:yes stop_codon:yes gene_type:complete
VNTAQTSLPENVNWLESCDTMVALGSATHGRNTVFAKNSDRPQEEAQPLVMVAGSDHSGGFSGTQFVDVPQVGHTYRHVGSKPYWCAGYEHGFNEHQVVIGNEALPSLLKEVKTPKLVGMEALRIALERSRSAEEAVDVITNLVSEFGQGKFANYDGVRTYDNIYLIADPTSAYVVECVGHDWAVSKVHDFRSISNVSQIRNDAEKVSSGAEAHAVRERLFDSALGEEFSFAKAFGDPNNSVSGTKRQCRSESLLSRREGKLDVRSMMQILSDHSDGENPEEPPISDIKGDVSICLHRTSGESMGASTASLIADLCATGERLPVYWTGMYSPCMTVFMPMFIEGDLPSVLSVGGQMESHDSPWWDFYRLTHYGMKAGIEARTGIRSELSVLQTELFGSAYEIARQGRDLAANGEIVALRSLLTKYMGENTRQVISKVKSMVPVDV